MLRLYALIAWTLLMPVTAVGLATAETTVTGPRPAAPSDTRTSTGFGYRLDVDRAGLGADLTMDWRLAHLFLTEVGMTFASPGEATLRVRTAFAAPFSGAAANDSRGTELSLRLSWQL